MASQSSALPPSDDRRWSIVNAAMRRQGYARSALIEALHCVQEQFGSIDDAALTYVAESLNVPASYAYGTASFYGSFSLQPQGTHQCVVCTGTACHLNGASTLLARLALETGCAVGKSRADKNTSLKSAACLGACGNSPVVLLDGKPTDDLTAAEIVARIEGWNHD